MQIGEAATVGEIFRFVWGSYRAIEHNAYIAKVAQLGTSTGGCGSDRDVGDASSEREATSRSPASPRCVEVDLRKISKIEFEQLELAVER